MAYKHEENTATVFENGEKTSEKQPDMTGKGNVHGKMYEFAAWRRSTKKGDDYYFLKFQPPNEKYAKKDNPDVGF